MSNAETSDVELVEAARAGKVAAFGVIVERYQQLVCAVAYSACGNSSVSEDIAQETFVTAWTRIQTLTEPAKLRGWLCSIASNKARDVLRKRKREVPADEADLATRQSEAPSPREVVLTNEKERGVWQALQQVPESYREVLVLFYREDQSLKQVSSLLGLSIAAVKQRLKRGRDVLRGSLGPVGAVLAESRPGKAFTVGVIAAIAAKSGTAAAATAAASTAAATGAKVTTAAKTSGGVSWLTIGAVAVLAIGGALYLALRSNDDSQTRAPSNDDVSATRAYPTLYTGKRLAPSVAGQHRLTGIVIGSNGQPVRGAVVTISGDPPRLATSGEGGVFSFDQLASETYGLSAFSSAGASIPTAVRVRADTGRVILRLEVGSAIEVDVRSAKTGKPIKGATVSIEARLRHSEETTDATGRVRFDGLTVTDNFVTVSADGYVSAENVVLIGGEPATYRRTFLLHRGGQLEIKLTDDKGNGIEGAEAELGVGTHATSLGKGVYRFDAIPSMASYLWIRHQGFLPRELLWQPAMHEHGSRPTFVLERGASVSGTVYDDEGQPAESARVVAVAELFLVRDAWTGSDGRFVIHGLPSQVRLVAHRHDVTSAAREVDATLKSDVELVLKDHCIRGRALTPSGTPAVGARVRAISLADEPMPISPAMDEASADGSFALCAVVPGADYRLAALAKGVSAAFFEQTLFGDVVAAAGEAGVTVEVARSGRLAARVVGGTDPLRFGVAIAAARYELSGAPSRPFESRSFEIDRLPPGAYSISIVAPLETPILIENVEIRPGETTDLGELEFPPRRRYSGIVRDMRGRPVVGALVLAARKVHGSAARLGVSRLDVDVGGDELAAPVFEAARTRTNSDGQFSLDYRVPLPGRLTIVADHPSFGRSVPTLVSATSQTGIELRLEEVGSVAGRVQGSGPALVVLARGQHELFVLDPEASTQQVVLSETDGRFKFDRVSPGSYRISAVEAEGEPRIGTSAPIIEVRSGRTVRASVPPVLSALPRMRNQALARLELLVDRMCTCTTIECGVPIEREIEALFARHAGPGEAVIGRYDAISVRLDRCLERIIE